MGIVDTAKWRSGWWSWQRSNPVSWEWKVCGMRMGLGSRFHIGRVRKRLKVGRRTWNTRRRRRAGSECGMRVINCAWRRWSGSMGRARRNEQFRKWKSLWRYLFSGERHERIAFDAVEEGG